MSCILEISGSALDVDELLESCPLTPDRVWHVGEPHALKDRFLVTSGATFLVSSADLDEFSMQVEEAIHFLKENRQVITSLLSFPGIESKSLRFAIGIFEDFAAHVDELPTEFVTAAANAGVSIELCHYASSK